MTSKIIRETLIKTRNEIIDNIIMILSTRPGCGIIFNKKNHASIKNCSGSVCELKSIHLKDLPPILNTGICQTLPSDDKLIIKTYLLRNFTFSFFLPAVKRSINLYLDRVITLKIITKRKIIPK